MIEVGKYYKSRNNATVLRATSEDKNGRFKGKIVGGNLSSEGLELDNWLVDMFEPCEAPQSTQPTPSTDKDTELRLECLKLAVEVNKGRSYEVDVRAEAQKYYDWITQKETVE